MADTQPPASPPPPAAKRFPYLTAVGTLAALFLFVGLMLWAYQHPNYLGEYRPGPPAADPAQKLDDVRARNRAVLDGTDPTAKMSADKAAAEVLAHTEKTKDAKHKFGRLPFPAPPKDEKAAPPAEKKK